MKTVCRGCASCDCPIVVIALPTAESVPKGPSKSPMMNEIHYRVMEVAGALLKAFLGIVLGVSFGFEQIQSTKSDAIIGG